MLSQDKLNDLTEAIKQGDTLSFRVFFTEAMKNEISIEYLDQYPAENNNDYSELFKVILQVGSEYNKGNLAEARLTLFIWAKENNNRNDFVTSCAFQALGHMYADYDSKDAKKNDIAASEFYDQSISLGNAGAMFARGLMHESGQGGEIDYPAAITLYKDAIERGHTAAMLRLALIYAIYSKSSTNLVEACKFYSILYYANEEKSPHVKTLALRLLKDTDLFEAKFSLQVIALYECKEEEPVMHEICGEIENLLRTYSNKWQHPYAAPRCQKLSSDLIRAFNAPDNQAAQLKAIGYGLDQLSPSKLEPLSNTILKTSPRNAEDLAASLDNVIGQHHEVAPENNNNGGIVETKDTGWTEMTTLRRRIVPGTHSIQNL
jgi:hypothetical protein